MKLEQQTDEKILLNLFSLCYISGNKLSTNKAAGRLLLLCGWITRHKTRSRNVLCGTRTAYDSGNSVCPTK